MGWNGSDICGVNETPHRTMHGKRHPGIPGSFAILFPLIAIISVFVVTIFCTADKQKNNINTQQEETRNVSQKKYLADALDVLACDNVVPANTESFVHRAIPAKDVTNTNIIQTEIGLVEMLPPPSSHKTTHVKPIFENEVHQEIANYIQPGVSMPPPPPISDAAARIAIDTEILDLEDDDPSIAEIKECVRGMLGELRKYLDEGRSANSFFRMLEHRQDLESDAVNQTRKTVLDLVREGKIAEAKETLDVFNKYLNGKGIPSVSVKQLRIKLKEENFANDF